ncbi:alpha-(1,3)-fucosyltransferase 9-like [Chanos chanos]|uniref:Fucosyltransferase n=1 Tax=Chanos chanos TaxID=29144 RepID=A0A6J2WPS9_CHACN|nr:alpha-(1,3)-fucosyltransferase 9-like [Chanos chanos]
MPSPLRPEPEDTMVLIWLWPFNTAFELDACQSLYNINGCYLTSDRQLYSKADAVLIHHRDIFWDLSNLPQLPRPPRQKWIWLNSESPSNSPLIPGLENLFNLSVTYRKDSDISVPYGSIIATDQTLEEFVPPVKKRLVCWIVSNWNPVHRRVQLYEDLQQHIRINTFGDHFNRHVSKQGYKNIVSSCKFYLSFENSEYKDYITEKLYNVLQLGTVPVVSGPSRQNYENFVPKDAFIHVNDFKSMKDLANYLLFLDLNDDMYRKYFSWRRNFEAKLSYFPVEHACYACDYVRRNKQYQTLTNLYEWYWGKS